MDEQWFGSDDSGLLLELRDRKAVSVPAGHIEWFLLDVPGVSPPELRTLAETSDGAGFCQRNRGALVIGVTVHEGVAVRLDAWRGLMSQADLYYSVRPSGAVIASDHLRNVMARLPLSDRYPSEQAVVEHHLFRRLTGSETISAAITRLGHADHLSIDLRSGAVQTERFDRFGGRIQERSPTEYLDMVEAELEASLEFVGEDGRPAVLFSGGVDSTLLMSYLRGRADAVTFVPDTPEFAAETTYAREAAAMLDVPMVEVPMPEADFLQMLEGTTELVATPCFDDSVPYFARLVQDLPHTTFVAGQGADSAFGMSLKIARVASWFRGPILSPVLAAAAKRAPGHLGYRLRQVAPMAQRFGRPPLDSASFAGAARSSGDGPILRQIAPDGMIEQIQRQHLAYVTDRIELAADPDSPLFSHIELAHWAILLTNPMMPSHASAKGAGKVVIGPYNTARVLEMSATIPPHDRYLRRLSAKYLLKELLARQVPDYSTNRHKKSTALPWQRFYERGPLTGFWDKYDVPSIFSGPLADEIVNNPTLATWTSMSFAVWEKHVGKNAALEPLEPTIARTYPVGGEA